MLKQAPPTPPPNAAPNREEAEWARFLERWFKPNLKQGSLV